MSKASRSGFGMDMAPKLDHYRETAISNNTREIYLNGDYSDLTIVCQDKTFKVHKSVICRTGNFFKAAVDFQGGDNVSIDLSDHSPLEVEAVLRFLYGFYLGSKEELEKVNYARLYALGDFFQIEELKQTAVGCFPRDSYRRSDSDVWEMIQVSLEMARSVYYDTAPGDRGLKESLLYILTLDLAQVLDRKDMRDKIFDIPELLADLQNRRLEEYQVLMECCDCGNEWIEAKLKNCVFKEMWDRCPYCFTWYPEGDLRTGKKVEHAE